MTPLDTSPEAAAIQERILVRMTPTERLRLSFEISESVRNLTRAGVQYRHPEWTDEQVSRELLRLMYGFERP